MESQVELKDKEMGVIQQTDGSIKQDASKVDLSNNQTEWDQIYLKKVQKISPLTF